MKLRKDIFYGLLLVLGSFFLFWGCSDSDEPEIWGSLDPNNRLRIESIGYWEAEALFNQARECDRVGVCWGEQAALSGQPPEIGADNYQIEKYQPGKVQYRFPLIGLKANTVYSVRVFIYRAGNSAPVYGTATHFSTADPAASDEMTPARPEWVQVGDDGMIRVRGKILSEPEYEAEEYGFVFLPREEVEEHGFRPDGLRHYPGSEQGDGTFLAAVDTTGMRPGIPYLAYAYTYSVLGYKYSLDGIRFQTPYSAGQLANQPVVTTQDNPLVNLSRLRVSGQVTDDKGHPLSGYGFQWSSRVDDFTYSTFSTGASNMDVSGIFSRERVFTSSGKIYFRAYAENEYGRAFGEIREADIPDFTGYLPQVVTDRSVSTDLGRAEVTGTLVSDGGYPVTESGFQYSTSSNFTSSDKKVQAKPDFRGKMKAALTDLKADTRYYFRTYAVNSVGTSYGQAYDFSFRLSDYEMKFRDVRAVVNSDNSVTFSAYLYDNKSQKIKEAGFCWTTSSYSEPTVSDYKEKHWSSSPPRTYEVKVSSYKFTKGKTYRARAYVITDTGFVFYSDKRDVVEFTIPND